MISNHSDSNRDNKQVYIMLTKYPDNISTIFRFFSRCNYSHASIGIDGPDGLFYSLVTTGFRIENPQMHPTFRGLDVPCRLYSLTVSKEIFEEVRQAIEHHIKQAKSYRYSFLGVLFCLLRLSIKRNNRYFCSQFVSEVLADTGAARMKKHSSLVLPDDFRFTEELQLYFSGTIKEFVQI